MKPLPKSWADMPIKKYIAYYNICKKVEKLDDIDKHVSILAVLRECSEDEIEALPIQNILNQIKDLKWMEKLPNTKISESFRINGNTYKAALTFDDMTAGQFMNFSDLCKDIKPEDYIYRMHELIGSMCTKVDRGIFFDKGLKFKRTIYTGYSDSSKIFYDKMPISIAYPYFVFFCNVIQRLSIVTQNYLKSKEKKLQKIIKKHQKRASQSNGVGS